MSNLYNLEPQPTAKVLLNTTAGDLVMELFAKQTPLASRNFLQHCLDGYYDNTIFHRLVPGFIIQGGDPSGMGTGGVSAVNEGAPFEDEFHSRLKFNRRGLLGMANSGDPNDNTSQFFFTLDQTPELQGKNTMFGRIEGDTIYNLMKMAEADLAEEGGDRPLYPTRILSAEILVNPFEDMVKRMHIAERTRDEGPKIVKKKRKAGKNLLSFGGDEGEDVALPVVKKKKVNPNFVVVEESNDTATPAASKNSKNSQDTVKAASTNRKELRVMETREKAEERATNVDLASPSPIPDTVKEATKSPADATSIPQPKSKPRQEREEVQLNKLDKVNQQIAELKASMKRTTVPVQAAAVEKKSALEAMIPATSTRGRKRGKAADDRGALDLFNSFKKRLEHIPAAKSDLDQPKHANHIEDEAEVQGDSTTAPGAAMDTEEALCDLHFIANCQSCTNWDKNDIADDADDDNDAEWMSHTLSFAKDTLGKDLEWRRKMEEFEVIDPREKARDIQQGQKKGKGDARDRQSGSRDWDKQRDKPKGKV